MGCVSVAGGFTGLRLPETLHHRLPQTLEEGELFGQDWTFDDCFRCIPTKKSPTGSYENLSQEPSDTALELNRGEPMVNGNGTGGSGGGGGGGSGGSRSTASGSGGGYEGATSTEKTPLEIARLRRKSMKRLVRQASTMDTQKTAEGAMQLTYWF